MNVKVLHLLASNKYSGAENVVCTIIDAFNGEIDMCYCSPDGAIRDALKEKNINFLSLEKFNRRNFKKILNEFKPDIIHAHDYRASILAAISGFKGKIISHLHNNIPAAKSWNIKTILYSMTTKKYNKVVGVSDKVYEEAIFKKRIKNKYATIYNYVNKDNVLNKAKQNNVDKKYDLFFIGRLTEQKDPFKFIEIVSQVKKSKDSINAIMIGDGELMVECKKIIKEKSLMENIELNGFNNNPFSIIKNCKIGIMPSKWEGFGLTAIESMILNKPVLNSGAGGLGEIFKNNKEFICKSNDEYVNKILELLESNNEQDFNDIINKYVDLKEWKEKLHNIYMK